VTNPTSIGPNRTGIGTSPIASKDAAESAAAGTPNPSFDLRAHHEAAVSRAKGAEPVGTLPPPASLKGVAKSVVEGVKGHHPNVFLDLLGERLAFERTGVRLYEALLCRYDAAEPGEGSPTRAQLEHVRDEELAHFRLLVKAMEKMGADPTAVTPSADISGTAGSGLLQVLGDSRTTLTQGLQAILIAELADNDGWNNLARVAALLGKDDLAADFRRALEEEEEHLASVRAWLSNSVQGQLGVGPQAAAPEQPEQPQPGV